MIKSPINYIGNKFAIIKDIINCFPNDIETFVDLFGGSGTVSLNVKANKIICNDIVPFVLEVLDGIKKENSVQDIITKIESVVLEYELSKENEDGFKRLRNDYNNGRKDWITFFVLLCYSFNYQFRFNNKMEYNSSFGRNRSCFSVTTKNKIIDSFNVLSSLNITFSNKDFRSFDVNDLTSNDFVYLDPPYAGSTANYSDGKRGFLGWNNDLELEMRLFCEKLDKKNVRFALSNNLAVNNTLKD